MAAQPLPIPGQSWPVLPPGVSYAKGLPAVDWPIGPAPDPSFPLSQHQTRPDPALAAPLGPATARGLVPRFEPTTSPKPPAAPAPGGLGHYLVLGLRQTARGLAQAWQTFSLATPAPAPFPPGVGAGAAPPEPASLGEPHV